MRLALFSLLLTIPASGLVLQTLLHRPLSFLLSQAVFALFLLVVGWITRTSFVRYRIEPDCTRALAPFWIFFWGPEGALGYALYHVLIMAILRRWKILPAACSANYLSDYLGGGVYQILGAELAPKTLDWHTLLAMVAAFGVMETVESACETLYIVIKEGRTLPNPLLHLPNRYVPGLVLFPINVLAVLIWTSWGMSHLLLLAIPLVGTIWILKLALRSSSEKQELNALYNFGEALQASVERDEVLRSLADATIASGIVPSLLVTRLGKDKATLVPLEARGLFDASGLREIPACDGLWKQVLEEGQPVVVESLTGHPLRPHIPEPIQSLLIVPLICGIEAEGALLAGHESPGFFHEDHERFLSVMANQVTSTLARVDLYDRLVTTNRELQEANLRIHKEMELARKVQMGLLPQEVPELHGCELAFLTIPAGEVGGDYYDFIFLSPKRIVIAIGDVLGKGLPAALLMAVTKSLFHTEAAQGDSPSAILGRMNRRLCDIMKSDHYVAFSLGILDLEEKMLTFANGGQTFPLRRFGASPTAEFIESGGIPLGIAPRTRYEDLSVTLPPECFLFFYTDGVVEAMNPEGDFFGFERLQEFAQSRKFSTADQFIQELSKEISDFRHLAEQNDDITVVAVQIP